MTHAFSYFFRPLFLSGCFWALLTCDAGLSLAEEPDPDRPAGDVEEQTQVDFKRDLLPVLQRNCLACHSQSEAEAALVLETADSILAGGDSGPAIVPGNAEESLLFHVASHREEPLMPPPDNEVGAKPLQPDQLTLLKLWIDQGAPARASDTTEESERIVWNSLPEHYTPIYALDVSPAGQLVAAGRGSEIVLYSVKGKRELQRLTDPNLSRNDGEPSRTAHLDVVQSLAFSPDGQRLASGGFRCVKIWQRPPIERADAFQLPEPPRVAISSSQGDSLAFCFRDSLQLRDTQGSLLAESEVEGEEIVAGVFLDADQLVTITEEPMIQIRSSTDLAVLVAWPISGRPIEIQAVVALQEGNLLAVASNNGLVRTWRRSAAGEFAPQIEREFRVCQPGQMRQVVAVADDLLAVACEGTVRLWDVREGRQQGQIKAGGPLGSVAVSPNGRQLVTLLADGSGKLWNLQNREVIRELPRNIASRAREASAKRAVGLKKERHRIAVADLEEAKKRQAESGKSLESSQEELKKAEQELPQKQKTLEKAKQNTREREQAVQELEEAVGEFKEKIAAITSSLDALKDSDAGSPREALQKQRNQQKQKLQQSENQLKKAKQELDKARAQEEKDEQAVATSQKAVDAARAAVGRAEKSSQRAADELAVAEKDAEKFAEKVKSSESRLAEVKQRASGSLSHFEQALFSRDAWRLYVRDRQGRVSAMASESGEPLDFWEGLPQTALLRAGPVRVVALEGQTAVSWNVDPPWTLAKVLGDTTDETTFVDRVTALSFSEDGTLLATGGGEPSRSGQVQLWRVSDWQRTALIQDAHSDVVYDLEFSPQGNYLASCSSDRMMKLIDISTAKPVKSFEGHTGHVLGVAWRADGRTLATAGADRVVKVWDAKDGTQQKSISGFQKEITSIHFLGLEDRFVFAAGDGQVISRNSNGDGRPAFPGYSDYVHRISSSSDGSLVAAAGQDGVVRLWDAEGKELAEFGKE